MLNLLATSTESFSVGFLYSPEDKLITIEKIQSSVPADHSSAEPRMLQKAPPIWFLALCATSSVVGLTILTPTLPLIKNSLGASSSEVQMLFTVYMVALAAGQLVYGTVSDCVGRRPVLLFGACLYTVSGFGAIMTDSIEVLTVLRGVQGLGAAACMSMVRAIVNDAFERNQAARQMSMISIILAVAPALAIAFGGVLAELAGWQATLALLAVSGVAIVITAWTYATETNLYPIEKINLRTVVSAYGAVLSSKLFLCWTIASGMQIGIFFSFNAVLAYQYQRHGYSMAEFGLWFALTPLCFLIGSTVNRRWVVAQGIERAAMAGSVLSLLAVVVLFTTQASGLTHALSIALPCCLFGFSNGIMVANATVGAINAAGENRGTGAGIVGAWQMATAGIAGAVIIALGGAQVFSIAAGSLIVMSLISVCSMVYVYRNRRAGLELHT